jgi:hypothetical protein
MNQIFSVLGIVSIIVLDSIVFNGLVFGSQKLTKEQIDIIAEQMDTILNYCYQHADRPNPVQDLVDKG